MRAAYWEIRSPGREQCRRDEAGRLLPRDDAIVLGRKFCAGCGHWRLISDFGYLRGRGLRSRCRVCHNRESSRRYYDQTPEQMERLREYWRFWQEAQRRKAGVPVRNYNRATVVDKVERVFLETDPLVRELRRQLDDVEEIARRARLPDKTIRRLLTGESRHVRLDVADKLTMALDLDLFVLYGDAELIRFPPPSPRRRVEVAS